MAQAGFNNDQNYTPSIKDSAIHVRKVQVPPTTQTVDSQGDTAEMTPGPNSGAQFAPKSNATPANYNPGAKRTGDK